MFPKRVIAAVCTILHYMKKKKYLLRNICGTFKSYLFRSVFNKYFLRDALSNMFHWYHKCILSKYCEGGK